jgi:hypothetical protein
MTASGERDELPNELIAAVIADPMRGRRRLPELVGQLEAEDQQTRLAAAWGCCLVATEYPDTVSYLVHRLIDRLGGTEANLELTHALDYLAARYPEAVQEVLEELETEAAEGADRGGLSLPETGAFKRSQYYDETPSGGTASGRIRLPKGDGEEDSSLTHATGIPDQVEERDTSAAEQSTDGSVNEADAEEPSDEPDAGEGSATLSDLDIDVNSIIYRSRFDQLNVLSTPKRRRYSTDFDALVGNGGDEEAIELRILHLPNDAVQQAFEKAGASQLDRWAAIDNHPHIVSLRDWHVMPRPWLTTSFAGDSLVDQNRIEHDRAIHDAIALADAIGYGHRNDTVHGGIDAGNIAYPHPSVVLDSNDLEKPLLNNFGLVHVFRPHTNPARFLDPRYAAPEYYDSRFGGIDAATDIYQLGAVIYRLYTGSPPVTGSFESVRSTVIGPETPVPGDAVEGIPAAIDEVVAKAMATEKLHRYETVEQLRSELVGLREEAGL